MTFADLPGLRLCALNRVSRIRAFSAGLAVACLAACAEPDAQVAMNAPDVLNLPDIAALQAAPVGGEAVDLATRDFLDLSFRMESGRDLPVLSRFEGPIRVAVSGPMRAVTGVDLDSLLARLRAEAGIDIALAGPDAGAQITIDFQPRATLRRLAPTAACFVVPGASSLAEFRANRNAAETDWGAVRTRTRAAIFIPAESSPQEIRDCLHEELAQAIGPLNDLYRLSDSVFNDDNFHTVLTGYDMAILRAYMAPELRSGMTREEVENVLPGVLARSGVPAAGGSPAPSTRAWTAAIQSAVSSGSALPARRSAAARALDLAEAQGWRDGRTAFSHFAVARLEVTRDPELARTHLDQAEGIWATLPGTAIHLAHIDIQRASMALAAGDYDGAVRHADAAMPALARVQNAALEATALLIKSEALTELGRGRQAARLRLDSRALARYGFGSGSDVEARVHQIASLSRRMTSN